MNRRVVRSAPAILALLSVSACAARQNQGAAAAASPVIPAVNITEGRAFERWEPVSREAADILGCSTAPNLPICTVTLPSAEEDSAFQVEGARLREHGEPRCRDLGDAIVANRDRVRMYSKALVKESGNGRLYGVGHTYELGDAWMVRVARRIDDLNERTLEEKKRTLRHEMSHTLGAPENPNGNWTAEDYATRCG
jgi:hypothetical protein